MGMVTTSLILDSRIKRALKIKAAESEQTVSFLVNGVLCNWLGLGSSTKEGQVDAPLDFSSELPEDRIKDPQGNFIFENLTDEGFRNLSQADQLEFHVQYAIVKGGASTREEAYQMEDPTGSRRQAAGIPITTELEEVVD